MVAGNREPLKGRTSNIAGALLHVCFTIPLPVVFSREESFTHKIYVLQIDLLIRSLGAGSDRSRLSSVCPQHHSVSTSRWCVVKDKLLFSLALKKSLPGSLKTTSFTGLTEREEGAAKIVHPNIIIFAPPFTN